MNSIVYAVNNEVFMAKDMIFGWCVEGNKLGLSEMVPISQIDKERIKVLQELYVGPTYPADLREALATQLSKLEVLEASYIDGDGNKKDLGYTAKSDELPPPPAEVILDLDLTHNLAKLQRASMKHIVGTFQSYPIHAVISGADLPADVNVGRMKPMFQPENFKVREPSLPVFPQIEPNGETGRFINEFGMYWKKIPGHPNHRYITNRASGTEDGVHVTLWLGDDENGPSIAIYRDMNFITFKTDFVNNTIDASKRDVYVLDVDTMYAGGVAMQKLKDEGLWQ